MSAISKDLFDFIVNSLHMPYEGEVTGLGTVYSKPIVSGSLYPKTKQKSNGVFLSTQQLLVVDTSSRSSYQNDLRSSYQEKKKTRRRNKKSNNSYYSSWYIGSKYGIWKKG